MRPTGPDVPVREAERSRCRSAATSATNREENVFSRGSDSVVGYSEEITERPVDRLVAVDARLTDTWQTLIDAERLP